MTSSNTDIKTNNMISDELAAMINTWVTSAVNVTHLPRLIIERAIKGRI
ncbi:MAG TPA: hypothetical protein VH796_09935 [Nitrososphaeraceae archaeon]